MPLNFLVVGASPVPGYECLQPLGGSAFTSMWQVRAPDGSTRVWKAIDLAVGNAALEIRNLELLIRLNHPALNPLLDYHTLAERKSLILETEPPVKTLRDRLTECQRHGMTAIPMRELGAWMRSVAEGLDFLNAPQHEFQGKKVAVHHRELRPENMLLFRESNNLVCKVGDFGLAKPVDDHSDQHSQGLVNYDYDPPEFYEGTTSPACDQYALAIVCCELRTGVLPFRGSILQQLTARLNDAPDLSAVESDAERAVLSRALQKDPAKRFGSCSDLVAEWLFAIADADAKTTAQESPSVRLKRSPVRPASPTDKTPSSLGMSPRNRRALPDAVQLVETACEGGSSVRLVRKKLDADAGQTGFGDPQQAGGPRDALRIASGGSGLLRNSKPVETPQEGASICMKRHSPPTTTIRSAPKENNIPMVWVYIISTIVLSAIALIAKEVVTMGQA